MYGINEKVFNNLNKYFKNNNRINKIILYGSRAKGTEKINSDIDLCIDCGEITEGRGAMVEQINEVIGVYSCDVIFYDSLNEEIKNQILRDGILIYDSDDIS